MLTLVVEGESRADPPEAEQGAPSARVPVNTWTDETGQVFARAYVNGPRRWIDWRGLGRFSFDPESTAVRVRACPNVSPDALRATFDRVIQPVILQALGRQALHASGVQGRSGAVLFCGLGRSGKSTLAYVTGRRAGYRQFADDAVVIQNDGDVVHVHPLPFAPALRQDADRFLRSSSGSSWSSTSSESASGPSGPGGPNGPRADHEDQKDLEDLKGRQVPVPIVCVFVLSQDPAAPVDVRIDRIAPSDAFALLLTHAHCFDETDAAATRQMVETYLAFAEYVPVLALTYRPDFAQLDALVDAVLAAATAPEQS